MSVSGLRLSYGATEVLRGIDLEVDQGETIFVIGPSGSGKSSFLRCCNRLEEPSAGSIVFDGQDLLTVWYSNHSISTRI